MKIGKKVYRDSEKIRNFEINVAMRNGTDNGTGHGSFFLRFFTFTFIFLNSVSVFAQSLNATGSAGATLEDKSSVWVGVFEVIIVLILAGLLLGMLGRIFKIYELSASISGKAKGINWNNLNGVLFLVFLILGFAGLGWELIEHGSKLLPESASVHGETIDNLLTITFWIIGFVFFVTQILLFGYPFLYRYNANRKALYYPDNDRLEQVWTAIPAVVLTVLVIFGFFAWRHIMSGEELMGRKPEIIEITGQQFQWDIRYPGKDGFLGRKNYKLITDINYLGVDFTDKNSQDDIIDKQGDTIYMPVNRPIKLVLGAKDVIHSCYMPYFRVQMNCVPGLPTYFYFTPKYTTNQMRAKLGNDNFNFILLCAKICGTSHYNMGRIIKVVDEQEYTAWKSHLKPWYDADMQKQIKIASQNLKNPKAIKQNIKENFASNFNTY